PHRRRRAQSDRGPWSGASRRDSLRRSFAAPYQIAYAAAHPPDYSLGIVEDDSQRVAGTRAQPAHAMTHVDAVGAARASNRPVMHGKDHAFTLGERNDFRP